MKLTLGFSPCPNDTFIFDALVNNRIDTAGLDLEVVLEDVETLNQWALQGKLAITKLSYGVLPLVLERYKVLNSGSALGKAVGPLLIGLQRNPQQVFSKQAVASELIAIPGENTTANLLFSIAYPDAVNKVFLRYDAIENFVASGKGLGVIIHENRFTYQDKGLLKITDLGDYWEKVTGHPIPLGGIVIRRDLPDQLQWKVDLLIRQSIEYAFSHYPQLTDYIRCHAQEMSEAVMRQHIDLYVNNYSLSLQEGGKQAIRKLLEVWETLHAQQILQQDIFLS